MKTQHISVKEIKREWHTLDANGEVLGRLSTKIASLLMGKGKVTYSPHIDMGDFVVVLNAKNIKLTGKKESQKVYYSHSGYPGGFKETSFEQMNDKHPERVIELAVRRMLPDNRLRAKRLNRLKVIANDRNPYETKKD